MRAQRQSRRQIVSNILFLELSRVAAGNNRQARPAAVLATLDFESELIRIGSRDMMNKFEIFPQLGAMPRIISRTDNCAGDLGAVLVCQRVDDCEEQTA